MRCPQCGSKMVNNKICAYCDISSEQVYFASNLKAKEMLAKNKTEEVLYTITKPRDVNKLKLILLTVFLGFLGIGNNYVGKKKKFFVLTMFFSIGMTVTFIKILLLQMDIENIILNNLASIGALLVVISFLFWLADLLAIVLGYYKYPVVLASKDVLNSIEENK